MKTKYIIAALVITLLAGAYYSDQVKAFGPQENNTMISTLAEKLGKSEDEVSAAFDAIHQERFQERQQAYQDRLTEAVENGELTAEQKQLILEKRAELQEEHEAFRAQRQEHRQELQEWADANDIDPQYILGLGMSKGSMGGRGMHGGGFGR